MEGVEFSAAAEQWANTVLTWIGFGTLIGLLAKAIMPGRDPGGAIATLAMGIGGAVIGCGVLAYFWEGQRVTPISPMGAVVATAGAFTLLFFYRLLGGHWFREDVGTVVPRPARRTTTSRGRKYVTHYEDE